MALICFYVQRFIAMTKAIGGRMPDAAQPVPLYSGEGRKAAMTSYTASGVRKSTAATGE